MTRVPATVEIDIDLCKGCALCVLFCPPGVLSLSDDLNAQGYRYPLLEDGCTGCENCYHVCPDFVFRVYRGKRSGPQADGHGR